MKRINNSRGFTMIEMIMLVVIGAFVVGGIVAFTQNVTKNTMTLKSRLAALDLAQQRIDMTLNDYYSNIAAGTTDTIVGSYGVRRVVTETRTPTPTNYWTIGLKQIVVLVDLAGGDFSAPLVRLETVMESQIPFENSSNLFIG